MEELGPQVPGASCRAAAYHVDAVSTLSVFYLFVTVLCETCVIVC